MIRRCKSCRNRYELPPGANRDGDVRCPGCGAVLVARQKSMAERMIAQIQKATAKR
jgi:LSD1 subclass zinc finger protein